MFIKLQALEKLQWWPKFVGHVTSSYRCLSLKNLELQKNESRMDSDWLGYIGDDIPPSYIGMIVNHSKPL